MLPLYYFVGLGAVIGAIVLGQKQQKQAKAMDSAGNAIRAKGDEQGGGFAPPGDTAPYPYGYNESPGQSLSSPYGGSTDNVVFSNYGSGIGVSPGDTGAPSSYSGAARAVAVVAGGGGGYQSQPASISGNRAAQVLAAPAPALAAYTTQGPQSAGVGGGSNVMRV